jgi:large subunit ribosomal protein L20
MRATNSVARHKRHKKVLKLAKGYRWGRKNLYRLALNATTKAGQYAYMHRKDKKRDFRRLWIMRISAALSAYDISYSRFMFCMTDKKIVLNRKMLADIAVREPAVFGEIVKAATA